MLAMRSCSLSPSPPFPPSPPPSLLPPRLARVRASPQLHPNSLDAAPVKCDPIAPWLLPALVESARRPLVPLNYFLISSALLGSARSCGLVVPACLLLITFHSSLARRRHGLLFPCMDGGFHVT